MWWLFFWEIFARAFPCHGKSCWVQIRLWEPPPLAKLFFCVSSGGKISTTPTTPVPMFTVRTPISTLLQSCCGTNIPHLITTPPFRLKIAAWPNSLPRTSFPTRLVTSFSFLPLLVFLGHTLPCCTLSSKELSTSQPSSISSSVLLSLFTGLCLALSPISGSTVP